MHVKSGHSAPNICRSVGARVLQKHSSLIISMLFSSYVRIQVDLLRLLRQRKNDEKAKQLLQSMLKDAEHGALQVCLTAMYIAPVAHLYICTLL